MPAQPNTRVLLLVEDNPADADLVRELLDQTGEVFQVVHVERADEAVRSLSTSTIDVVLLDLQLPDSEGIPSVAAVRAAAGDVPIVVLTGTNDEELGTACIDAGAQDYLPKGEIRVQGLRRSIQYAISRGKESQKRDVHVTLAGYQSLSSANSSTTVTAAMAGSGALRERYPDAFLELAQDYTQLLILYLDSMKNRCVKPRESMEQIVTRLGDSGSAPRDLIDVHIAGLDTAVAQRKAEHSGTLIVESRLLALEMMGLLVDYYRTGIRRHLPERKKS